MLADHFSLVSSFASFLLLDIIIDRVLTADIVTGVAVWLIGQWSLTLVNCGDGSRSFLAWDWSRSSSH